MSTVKRAKKRKDCSRTRFFLYKKVVYKKLGQKRLKFEGSGGLKRSKPKKVAIHKFHKFWKLNFKKCAFYTFEEQILTRRLKNNENLRIVR